MLHKVAFTLIVMFSCGGALWLGRDNERWTALALLIGAAASVGLQTSQFFEPESGILLVDLGLLAYLIWLALRSDRFWPLYAAGFQMVGTTIHLARLADPNVLHSAYAFAQIFWAYPVLLALAAGTWLEARYRTH